MAIERIEWQCPQCERRYAIPSNLPRPSLCPKCQADDAERESTPPASTLPSAPEPTPPFRDDVQFETPPGEPDGGRYRRKYSTLRVISLFYRCLAGVILLATLIAFVSGLVAVLQADIQSQRWIALGMSLGSLVVGTFWSVTVLAFAELIQLMLDMEQNTRKR